jgi:uncharacterized protein YecE (DUF72 family)
LSIRFGPAGWSYPDSPGKVYPAGLPKKFDVLEFYARYYDTIEINASFYAPQPPRNYASWARRVAVNDRFRFTAKLWQGFTHEKREWSKEDVAIVQEGLEELRSADRLGAVLAQFPWSFKPSAESAAVLERIAEDFRGWPVVVEVRHGAWAQREHALLLKKLGLGFANIDQPTLGDSLEPTAGATARTAYVRLHGRRADKWFDDRASTSERYDYLYSAKELEPWAERIRKVAKIGGVEDVYVIANNHFEGKGAANALMLRSMVTGEKVPAPPVLYQTYEQQLKPYAILGS